MPSVKVLTPDQPVTTGAICQDTLPKRRQLLLTGDQAPYLLALDNARVRGSTHCLQLIHTSSASFWIPSKQPLHVRGVHGHGLQAELERLKRQHAERQAAMKAELATHSAAQHQAQAIASVVAGAAQQASSQLSNDELMRTIKVRYLCQSQSDDSASFNSTPQLQDGADAGGASWSDVTPCNGEGHGWRVCMPGWQANLAPHI